MLNISLNLIVLAGLYFICLICMKWLRYNTFSEIHYSCLNCLFSMFVICSFVRFISWWSRTVTLVSRHHSCSEMRSLRKWRADLSNFRVEKRTYLLTLCWWLVLIAWAVLSLSSRSLSFFVSRRMNCFWNFTDCLNFFIWTPCYSNSFI